MTGPSRIHGRGFPVLLACAAFLLLPVEVEARQASGPWISAGVGGAIRMDDPSEVLLVDRFGFAGHLRTGYFVGGVGVGVEWSRLRLDSSFAPLTRQTLSLILVRRTGGEDGALLKAGAGMGMATRIDVDGPPPDGTGDRVVSIGEIGGIGATVGISSRVPVRRGLSINPGADVYVQRVDGATSATLVVSVGLLAGRGLGHR